MCFDGVLLFWGVSGYGLIFGGFGLLFSSIGLLLSGYGLLFRVLG